VGLPGEHLGLIQQKQGAAAAGQRLDDLGH
jgi:hypothetical protein